MSHFDVFVIGFVVLVSIGKCIGIFMSEARDYCSGDVFTPECPKDHVILMTSAQYGRMTTGPCTKDNPPSSLGCGTDVLSVTDRLCSGKQSCEISLPNEDMDEISTCENYFRFYLQASYQCVRVLPELECDTAKRVYAHSRPTYISSLVSKATRCGHGDQTWILQASLGQYFSVHLIDFNHTEGQRQLHRSHNTDVSNCAHSYGYVDVQGHRTKLCPDGRRRINVFGHSNGHAIQIQLDRSALQSYHYLIEYQVFGCGDLTPAGNAWIRRDGNSTLVGCHDGKTTWQLQCHGNRWQGVFGNCSQYVPAVNTLPLQHSGSLHLSSVGWIVLVTCSAITISIAIAVTGVVWFKKYAAQPPSQRMYLSRSRLSSEYTEKYEKVSMASLRKSRSSLGYRTASDFTGGNSESSRVSKPRGRSVGDNTGFYSVTCLGDDREGYLGGSSMMSVQTYDSGVSVFYNTNNEKIESKSALNVRPEPV